MITQSRQVAKRHSDTSTPSPWDFKGCSPWLYLEAARRFRHVNRDFHILKGFRGTAVSARERQDLIRRPRHCYANQISVAHDPIRGVEVDPAGARQVGLYPRMGGA